MNEDHKDLTGALNAIEANNKIMAPEEQAKRSTFVTAEGERASASLIRPLRTLEGDTATMIQKQQQSLSSMRVAEQEKHPERMPAPAMPQHHFIAEHPGLRKILVISAFVSIIAVVGVALYVLSEKITTQKPEVVVVNTPPPLIAIQSSATVTYDKKSKVSLAQNIQEALSTQSATSTGSEEIVGFDIKEGEALMPVGDVLTNLSPNVPGSLVRALGSLYLVGGVRQETKQPFIIVRINNYDSAFAGMLDWESSLDTIFTGIGSGNTPTNGPFQDILIKNKDARIVRDSNGNGQILYSFYDKKTLVITTNESVYATLINALNSAPVVQ